MSKSMKTTLTFHVLLWLALVPSAARSSAVAAPSPEPKTVADFFLLVPEKYVGYDLPFRQELLRGERRGAVIDIPNGYISWNASDNPEEFEFVIFKKNSGKYIVAFSAPGEPELFDSTFVLLSYDNGRWRDVTKALLPVTVNKLFNYKLPRQGQTIVVAKDWRTRYRLMWKNDRFRFSRR